MILGYFALTELSTEKEIDVYYGNQLAPALTTVTCRFKLHLLPADIQSVTLAIRDFVTGETEIDTIYSLKEAIETGFIKSINADEKTANISNVTISRACTNKIVERAAKHAADKKA